MIFIFPWKKKIYQKLLVNMEGLEQSQVINYRIQYLRSIVQSSLIETM